MRHSVGMSVTSSSRHAFHSNRIFRRTTHSLVCVSSIHIHLSHHREVRLEALADEVHNFLLCARLLRSELVAGEAKNGETLVLVLVVQLGGGGVPALGVAALGGGIHDEDHLALVLGKIVRFAVRTIDREVENGFAGVSHVQSEEVGAATKRLSGARKTEKEHFGAN